MKFVTAILMALGMISWANATILQGRDITGKPVDEYDPTAVFLYDPVAKITWLRDANANGAMTWADANAWAASLKLGRFDGWRLPTLLDTGNLGCDSSTNGSDCGYNSRRTLIEPTLNPNPQQLYVFSEYARLFYDVLGNLALYSPTGQIQPNHGLVNFGPFLNLVSRDYWTGLDYSDQPSFPTPEVAWLFGFSDGVQGTNVKGAEQRALAVRPGDVADVPLPATLALLGLGLVGFASRRRSTGKGAA